MPSKIAKNIFAMIKGVLDDDMLHLSGAGAPTDGTSGTGVGRCGKGSTYINISTGVAYINEGTKASPLWKQVGSGVQYSEVTITNAEALVLRAAPKTLVAAPGAGKYLEFCGLVLFFDRVAAYTESTANLTVKYVNGAGTAASQAIEATGFADAAADAITTGQPKIDVLGVKTLFENQLLCLHNIGAGEWGAGNAGNVIRAKTYYRVWDTGF